MWEIQISPFLLCSLLPLPPLWAATAVASSASCQQLLPKSHKSQPHMCPNTQIYTHAQIQILFDAQIQVTRSIELQINCNQYTQNHWTCQWSSQINILLKEWNYPVVLWAVLQQNFLCKLYNINFTAQQTINSALKLAWQTSKSSLTIALKNLKTIEKPLKPMVGPSKNIQWWWSNVVKTIEKPLTSIVTRKKNINHSIALKNWPSLWSSPIQLILEFSFNLLGSSTHSPFQNRQFWPKILVEYVQIE